MNVLFFDVSREFLRDAPLHSYLYEKGIVSRLVVLSDREQSRGESSGEVVRPEISSRDSEI